MSTGSNFKYRRTSFLLNPPSDSASPVNIKPRPYNNKNSGLSALKPVRQCELSVSRIFPVSPAIEDIDSVRSKLLKNQFFHHQFDTSLTSACSQAFYKPLCDPQAQRLLH